MADHRRLRKVPFLGGRSGDYPGRQTPEVRSASQHLTWGPSVHQLPRWRTVVLLALAAVLIAASSDPRPAHTLDLTTPTPGSDGVPTYSGPIIGTYGTRSLPVFECCTPTTDPLMTEEVPDPP